MTFFSETNSLNFKIMPLYLNKSVFYSRTTSSFCSKMKHGMIIKLKLINKNKYSINEWHSEAKLILMLSEKLQNYR